MGKYSGHYGGEIFALEPEKYLWNSQTGMCVCEILRNTWKMLKLACVCVCTIGVSKTRVCQPLWRDRLSEHCRTLFSRLSSFLLPNVFILFIFLLSPDFPFIATKLNFSEELLKWSASLVDLSNSQSYQRVIPTVWLDSEKSVTGIFEKEIWHNTVTNYFGVK